MATNRKSNAGNVVLYILCALVVIGIAAILVTNMLQRNSIFKDDLFKTAISAVLEKQPANVKESDISAIRYLSVNATQTDSQDSSKTMITLQIGYDDAIAELEKGDEADQEALGTALKGVELPQYISNFEDIALFTGLKALVVNGEMKDLSNVTAKDIVYLYISSDKLADVSNAAEFTALKEVSFSGGELEDVSALAGCTSLTGLYLNSNKIKDISALKTLTALEYIDLSGNEELSDISALADCKSVKVMALDDTAVEDISAIKNLTNLETLSFAKANVSDISPVASCTGLTTLIANANGFSDITAIKELTKLTSLDLSSNKISDISALEGLKDLEYLYLTSNNISDVSALAGHDKLVMLLLDDNDELTDITPIKDFVYSYFDGTGNAYVALPTELQTKIQEEIAAKANVDTDTGEGYEPDETPTDETPTDENPDDETPADETLDEETPATEPTED